MFATLLFSKYPVLSPTCQKRRRVLDLDVRGQDEDRYLRHFLANRLRRPETFGGMVGRHPDVHDDKVGPVLTSEIE